MTAGAVFALLSAIEAAIQAAPKVVALVNDGKQFFTSLFAAGLISKEVQDACHASVDAKALLVAQGIVPDAWQVQPDPSK